MAIPANQVPVNHADGKFQNFRFRVIVGKGSDFQFEATDVSGIGVQRDVVEIQEGGENTHFHKRMGPSRFTNIQIRFGSSQRSAPLFKWINDGIYGNVERKDGAIEALSPGMNPTVVARWEFRKAWPVRYDGPNFQAGVSAMATELLELAHEGFELKMSPPSGGSTQV